MSKKENKTRKNNKEEIVMNKKVANKTKEKAFEEIESKVQGTFAEIGQKVQEKVTEMQNKEFIKEQEEIMAEVKERNEEYNKMIEKLEQERQDGLAEMKESLQEYNEEIEKNELEKLRKEIKERKKNRTQEEKEEDKRYYKSRHKYWHSVKTYATICNKAIEERNKQLNSNWKNIQELLSDNFYSYLKGIRTKVDFCQIIYKRTNEIYTEGIINEVLEKLLNLMYEVLRDEKYNYPI